MSYTIAGTPISSIPTLLDSTSVTDVFTATKRTTILSVVACNYDASATNYSLEMFDGTNSFPIYGTESVAAHTREIYNEPFVLSSDWKLRATAGNANRLNIIVTYAEPDAMVQRTGYEAFTR